MVNTNIKLAKVICSHIGGCVLDHNNILWKNINGKFIGKRSVWTFDFTSSWLEDTTLDNIKSWWCGGKDADYSEIFEDD